MNEDDSEANVFKPSASLANFCNFLKPYSRPGTITPKEGNAISLALIELMADGKIDGDLLKFTSRFFTPEEYEEVVTERNILHLCGYPLCNADPKGLIKQKHQINYRHPSPTMMILPATYLSQYCSKEHYQASLFFKEQLSELSIFSRSDITCKPYGTMSYELQTVLLEEVAELSTAQNRSMESIIQEFKSLSVNQQQQQQQNQQQAKPPADPFLVDLSNGMKKVKLVERDPSKPYIDAYDAPMGDGEDQSGSTVEGYTTKFKFS